MLIPIVVDLLLISGLGCIGIGVIFKLLTTLFAYRGASPFFLTPMDFATLGGLMWLLALALIGRTWLRLNESALASLRWRKTQFRYSDDYEDTPEAEAEGFGRSTRDH